MRLIENSVAIITCEQLVEAQGTHMAAMCCDAGAIATHPPLEGKGGWAPGWCGTGVTP